MTLSGDTPAAGALLIRNIFRLFDALPAFYMVGLVATVLTRRSVRLGDLAAGTVLVKVQGDSAALGRIGAAIKDARLSPDAIELMDELLGRWATLGADRRQALARTLLAKFDTERSMKPSSELDDHGLKARIEYLLSRKASA